MSVSALAILTSIDLTRPLKFIDFAESPAVDYIGVEYWGFLNV